MASKNEKKSSTDKLLKQLEKSEKNKTAEVVLDDSEIETPIYKKKKKD